MPSLLCTTTSFDIQKEPTSSLSLFQSLLYDITFLNYYTFFFSSQEPCHVSLKIQLAKYARTSQAKLMLPFAWR